MWREIKSENERLIIKDQNGEHLLLIYSRNINTITLIIVVIGYTSEIVGY